MKEGGGTAPSPPLSFPPLHALPPLPPARPPRLRLRRADGRDLAAANPPPTPQLEESGQREKLKQAFRERLVECGWRDEIAEQCRQIVKDQAAESGAESVTVQGIAEELFPVALSTVPDHVKAEILAKIRSAIISSKNQ